MKNILLLIVIFILSCSSFAKKLKSNESDKYIPIIAWYSIPAKETTLLRYQELKDAGITYSYTRFADVQSMQKALDIAYIAGVKMLVSCPELKTNTEVTVHRFMNHPAVAGYMLTDEPSRTDFPELGDWVKKIRVLDDKHFCYINLFPNHAYLGRGTKTYEEYVNLFVKEVPVQLLTFDDYPILGDSVRADWYENLETIAKASNDSQRPFWAFALSVAHGKYPLPIMEHLRLQVFSNLAYGAQGIQYFTYWTPPADTIWHFNNAPISHDGKRTIVYERVRQMNNEIKALSSVFLGAKLVSVVHTGKDIPIGTKRLSNLPVPIESLKTEGLGAVVSTLKKDGNYYLVVVNRDFKNQMKLSLKASKKIKQVFKNGKTKSSISVTINVDPGDLAIFSWKENQK